MTDTAHKRAISDVVSSILTHFDDEIRQSDLYARVKEAATNGSMSSAIEMVRLEQSRLARTAVLALSDAGNDLGKDSLQCVIEMLPVIYREIRAQEHARRWQGCADRARHRLLDALRQAAPALPAGAGSSQPTQE